MHKGACYLP